MKKILSLSLIASMLFAFGCGHKKASYDPETATRVNEKDGVSVEIEWVKNKKDGVDILMRIASQYKEDVTISNSSFLLEFNGEKYALKSSEGEMTLVSRVNYEKLALFRIPDHKKASGNITLYIDPMTKGGKKIPALKMTLELPK